MTMTSRQQPTSPQPITDEHTTQRTDTDTDEQPRTDTATTKTKRSHLGITIRGAAPACGRQRAAAAAPEAGPTGSMIVPAGSGWSGC